MATTPAKITNVELIRMFQEKAAAAQKARASKPQGSDVQFSQNNEFAKPLSEVNLALKGDSATQDRLKSYLEKIKTQNTTANTVMNSVAIPMAKKPSTQLFKISQAVENPVPTIHVGTTTQSNIQFFNEQVKSVKSITGNPAHAKQVLLANSIKKIKEALKQKEEEEKRALQGNTQEERHVSKPIVESRKPIKKQERKEEFILSDYPERIEKMKILPINEHFPEILEKHNAGKLKNETSAIYLQAPTGTGKTVGFPPMLATDPNTKGQVFVASPNVMPARACFKYINKFYPKGFVGYACDGERNYDSNTKLIYVTKGYLVQYLLGSILKPQDFQNIDTIMVDEAHDETIDSTLILWLVRFLKLTQQINLIIASATSEAKNFKKMFPDMESVIVQPPSFKVKTFFHTRNYQVRSRFDLLKDMVEILSQNHEKQCNGYSKGDVLVVVPGQNDIESIINSLNKMEKFKHCVILAAYSSQGSEENEKILMPCPDDKSYKIIVGTAIVQQSLTIDGVTFCLDSGFEKQKSVDDDGVGKLEEVTSSKSTCLQRRGRVGRTQEGTYYVMMTQEQYDNLDPLPVPEIERMPLYMQCLQLIGAGLDPYEIMYNVDHFNIDLWMKRLINTILTVPKKKQLKEGKTIYEVTEEGRFVQSIPMCGIDGARLVYHSIKSARVNNLNESSKNKFISTSIIFAIFLGVQDYLFWLPSTKIGSKENALKEITRIKEELHKRFKKEDCFSTAYEIFGTMLNECTKNFNKRTRLQWCKMNAINGKTLEDLFSGFVKTFERVSPNINLIFEISDNGIPERDLFEKIFETIFSDKVYNVKNGRYLLQKDEHALEENMCSKPTCSVDFARKMFETEPPFVIVAMTRRESERGKQSERIQLASKVFNLHAESTKIKESIKLKKEEEKREKKLSNETRKIKEGMRMMDDSDFGSFINEIMEEEMEFKTVSDSDSDY